MCISPYSKGSIHTASSHLCGHAGKGKLWGRECYQWLSRIRGWRLAQRGSKREFGGDSGTVLCLGVMVVIQLNAFVKTYKTKFVKFTILKFKKQKGNYSSQTNTFSKSLPFDD